MRACPAQIQARERRLVLGRTGQRSHHEELVEGEFHVVPVPTGNTKFPLDVERGQKLSAADRGTQARRVALDDADGQSREMFALLFPAGLKRIRRILNDRRQDVLAGRRKRCIMNRRNRDLKDRLLRVLPVFCVVVGVLDVLKRWSNE